jgi:ATP-binding cassette subfamily B protein
MWRLAFGLVQVMDPSRGRRWVRARAFPAELFVHEMDVAAEVWRTWAAADEFRGPLAIRLRALGVADAEARIELAFAADTWRAIATLDAAARMAGELVDGRALAAGPAAARVIDTLIAHASSIPAAYWYAREAGDDTVRVRGHILLQVTGRKPPRALSRELAAVLEQPSPRPWHAVVQAMLAEGWLRPAALAAGIALSGLGLLVETMLFRAMFEIGSELVIVPQLFGALGALAVFSIALLLLEVVTRGEAWRLGRHVEIRLRAALLAKLPRLALPYFRSRPMSDMANRAHNVHRLRELAPLGLRILRACIQIVATAGALIWLAPACTPLAIALALVAILPPFLASPALAERELRVRTHAGALGVFSLDALTGALSARACGLAPTLRREHEALLIEWSRAARAEHRLATRIAAVHSGLGYALAIALYALYAGDGSPASVLLLAYWALSIPAAGEQLATAVRELPAARNLTLRFLEPLGALEDAHADASAVAPAPPAAAAVSIELTEVTVVLAGNPILRELELAIAPREHVAVVGRSGGGKSTLVSLLLGLTRPAAGELRVDGAPLDAAALAALRTHTVWIDPAVTLWNDSLADNLRYGQPDADIGAVTADAELVAMIARLPEGLATRLGEGGGLVSGGEGQRVRLGRGLARRAPRLVVLDEPFRGLDHATRRRQLIAARARWRDATLVCVTHDVEETREFPRVLVVEDGRIVEDGRPHELAARADSRYAALLADEARARAAWARWQRMRLVDGRVERIARSEQLT